MSSSSLFNRKILPLKIAASYRAMLCCFMIENCVETRLGFLSSWLVQFIEMTAGTVGGKRRGGKLRQAVVVAPE